jgi:hypothetical protein
MHQLTPVQVLFVWYGLRPLCFPAVCAISSSGITAAAATIAVRTFTVCNYIAAAFFEIAYVCAATVHYELVLLYSPSAAHVPESETRSAGRIGSPACRPACSCERISFGLTMAFLPPKITSFSLSKKKHTRDKKTAAAAAATESKKG